MGAERQRTDELSLAVKELDAVLGGLGEDKLTDLNLAELLSNNIVTDYCSELLSMSKVAQEECELDFKMSKLENALTWKESPKFLDELEASLALPNSKVQRATISAYFDILKYHDNDDFYLDMIRNRYHINFEDLQERAYTEYKREFVKGRYDLCEKIARHCRLDNAKVKLACTMIQVKSYMNMIRDESKQEHPL